MIQGVLGVAGATATCAAVAIARQLSVVAHPATLPTHSPRYIVVAWVVAWRACLSVVTYAVYSSGSTISIRSAIHLPCVWRVAIGIPKSCFSSVILFFIVCKNVERVIVHVRSPLLYSRASCGTVRWEYTKTSRKMGHPDAPRPKWDVQRRDERSRGWKAPDAKVQHETRRTLSSQRRPIMRERQSLSLGSPIRSGLAVRMQAP